MINEPSPIRRSGFPDSIPPNMILTKFDLIRLRFDLQIYCGLTTDEIDRSAKRAASTFTSDVLIPADKPKHHCMY